MPTNLDFTPTAWVLTVMGESEDLLGVVTGTGPYFL